MACGGSIGLLAGFAEAMAGKLGNGVGVVAQFGHGQILPPVTIGRYAAGRSFLGRRVIRVIS
jgi:hypothetical protein